MDNMGLGMLVDHVVLLWTGCLILAWFCLWVFCYMLHFEPSGWRVLCIVWVTLSDQSTYDA
ncbi:hypothetical protein ACS0TY_019816 [Phlomoides rotata]